ncbi:MAG: O-antigen ligase family protein [Verrucomicrobiota bacterium]|nr:O-antigen ligase family protein [Verrucomicrobiota bacterium]
MAKISPTPNNSLEENIFATLVGIFLALALLKFGNPIILESQIAAPKDIYEMFFQSWPVYWSRFFLVVLFLMGIKIGKWKRPVPPWILILPLLWLAWQIIAATQSIDSKLSNATVQHFVSCVVCFYLGWFVLSELKNFQPLWIGLLLGFVWMIRVGFDQHFGGLEETRRYFYLYIFPTLAEPAPGMLKKISSNRIFATLFYPNSLAGALLLFLPITIFSTGQIARKFSKKFRVLFAGGIGLSALACLYWSGSKGGWLIILLLGLVALFHRPFSRRLKLGLAGAVLILGLGGFFLRYAAFFEKGATSVGARFDYWRAAAQIARENPVFGTGPATFSISYKKIKSADAEMARLCHNDFLEQACDSGVVGFLTFFIFISASLIMLYRRRNLTLDDYPFYLWLGVLGVNLQSLVEFNLYIPALAWPNFLFLGWLWGLKTLPQKTPNGAK